MTTFEHHDFSPGRLIQNGFLLQHPVSLSAPSGFSMSLPTTAAYQHDHCSHSSSYYTPRTLAPHPGYLPSSAAYNYNHGEGYAISSNSNSARVRSGSSVSTVSASYSRGSPRTIPTSPHLLDGGSQHQTAHIDSSTTTQSLPSTFQEQLPSYQVNEEPSSARAVHGRNPMDMNFVTDDRVFCPHGDCQDDEGRPRKFFSRKADVTRHYKSCHDITYIDCPKPKCDRKGRQGFTRRDHLTEHLRGFHMEALPKRQTMTKRPITKSGKNSYHDNEVNDTSEDVTPADPAVDSPGPRSRGSSFGGQADRKFKREQHSSSDEEIQDDFQMDEDYHQTNNHRRKTVGNGSKGRIKRPHQYPRRPSKGQSAQASCDAKRFRIFYQVPPSPHYATSQTAHPASVYGTHHATNRAFVDGHMMSPVYTTHADMNHYCNVSSVAEPYHSLYNQPTTRYSLAHHQDEFNDIPYQHISE